MSFVPPVTIEPDTVAVVQDLLRSHPHFLLYFEAALSAPVNDESNRKIMVGMKRRGLALSIDFERVTIRTTVGDLSNAELLQAVTVPRRAELHSTETRISTIPSSHATGRDPRQGPA